MKARAGEELHGPVAAAGPSGCFRSSSINQYSARQALKHGFNAASIQKRTAESFAKQGLMQTLGATLGAVGHGHIEIVLIPAPEISQQHGFVHAGTVSAIADSAAGYAALSVMPMDRGVLTTEFKINLLAPAAGDKIIARGKVIKSGRTLTLAQSEVFAVAGGKERLVALLTATMMAIEGRDGIAD